MVKTEQNTDTVQQTPPTENPVIVSIGNEDVTGKPGIQNGKEEYYIEKGDPDESGTPKESVSPWNGVSITTLIVLALLLAFLFRVFKIAQKQSLEFMAQLKEMKKDTEAMTEKVASLEDKCKILETKFKTIPGQPEKTDKHKPESKPEPTLVTPAPEAPIPPEPAKPTIKYGNFAIVEATGQLSVKNKVLKADRVTEWFEFEIAPDEGNATYTINARCEQEILADLGNLRLAVQSLDMPAGTPQSIEVISKGTLKKDGSVWIVVEKMQIKLK